MPVIVVPWLRLSRRERFPLAFALIDAWESESLERDLRRLHRDDAHYDY